MILVVLALSILGKCDAWLGSSSSWFGGSPQVKESNEQRDTSSHGRNAAKGGAAGVGGGGGGGGRGGGGRGVGSAEVERFESDSMMAVVSPRSKTDARVRVEEMLARAEDDQQHSCWREAYVQLSSNCRSILSEESSKAQFALLITNCYLESSGRKSVNCWTGEPVEDCTKSMDEHTFAIYTEFFLDTAHTCHHLQSEVFKLETERSVNELKASAAWAGETVREMAGRSEEILDRVHQSAAIQKRFSEEQRTIHGRVLDNQREILAAQSNLKSGVAAATKEIAAQALNVTERITQNVTSGIREAVAGQEKLLAGQMEMATRQKQLIEGQVAEIQAMMRLREAQNEALSETRSSLSALGGQVQNHHEQSALWHSEARQYMEDSRSTLLQLHDTAKEHYSQAATWHADVDKMMQDSGRSLSAMRDEARSHQKESATWHDETSQLLRDSQSSLSAVRDEARDHHLRSATWHQEAQDLMRGTRSSLEGLRDEAREQYLQSATWHHEAQDLMKGTQSSLEGLRDDTKSSFELLQKEALDHRQQLGHIRDEARDHHVQTATWHEEEQALIEAAKSSLEGLREEARSSFDVLQSEAREHHQQSATWHGKVQHLMEESRSSLELVRKEAQDHHVQSATWHQEAQSMMQDSKSALESVRSEAQEHHLQSSSWYKEAQGMMKESRDSLQVVRDEARDHHDQSATWHREAKELMDESSSSLKVLREETKEHHEITATWHSEMRLTHEELLDSQRGLSRSAKEIARAQEAFVEKQAGVLSVLDQLFVSVDHVIALCNGMIMDSFLLKSVLFYSASAVLIHCVTSVPRTHSARFALYVAMVACLAVEWWWVRWVTPSPRSTTPLGGGGGGQNAGLDSIKGMGGGGREGVMSQCHSIRYRTRMAFVFGGVLILAYSALTYRDYSALSYQMLLHVQQKLDAHTRNMEKMMTHQKRKQQKQQEKEEEEEGSAGRMAIVTRRNMEEDESNRDALAVSKRKTTTDKKRWYKDGGGYTDLARLDPSWKMNTEKGEVEEEEEEEGGGQYLLPRTCHVALSNRCERRRCTPGPDGRLLFGGGGGVFGPSSASAAAAGAPPFPIFNGYVDPMGYDNDEDDDDPDYKPPPTASLFLLDQPASRARRGEDGKGEGAWKSAFAANKDESARDHFDACSVGTTAGVTSVAGSSPYNLRSSARKLGRPVAQSAVALAWESPTDFTKLVHMNALYRMCEASKLFQEGEDDPGSDSTGGEDSDVAESESFVPDEEEEKEKGVEGNDRWGRRNDGDQVGISREGGGRLTRQEEEEASHRATKFTYVTPPPAPTPAPLISSLPTSSANKGHHWITQEPSASVCVSSRGGVGNKRDRRSRRAAADPSRATAYSSSSTEAPSAKVRRRRSPSPVSSVQTSSRRYKTRSCSRHNSDSIE
ncbi:hypothetical protein CBR_g12548 [Chara braunii]|uniref:Uncharacterized protein n=1 Tax=Chara braunii TaxID=69332 RepID=A0A388JSP8_CHABU|nr:hypothetical protein CBR_g12548 [Chara braunii]|eukprot:GBG60810.1 hypothetical protein CBR_g12548 [Chara braunii]